jgi:hypothetical protein
MERQSGEKAHHALRHCSRRQRQSMVLLDGSVRNPVLASSDSHQHALAHEPGQHLAVDAVKRGLLRGKRTLAAGYLDGSILLTGWHV